MDILSKRQKDILQYTFLLFLIVLTTYIVSTTLDISILPDIIKIIDFKYILLGFGLVLLYILLEGYIIKIILNSVISVVAATVEIVGFDFLEGVGDSVCPPDEPPSLS